MPAEILERLIVQDLGEMHMALAKARARIAMCEAEIEKQKAIAAGAASSLTGGERPSAEGG